MHFDFIYKAIKQLNNYLFVHLSYALPVWCPQTIAPLFIIFKLRKQLNKPKLYKQTNRHLALFRIGHDLTVPDTFGQVRTPWDRLRQDRSGQNRIVFSQTLGLDFKIQNLVCQYQPGLNRTFTSRLVLNRINGLTELRCSAKLKICYWSWSCHNFQIKSSLGPVLKKSVASLNRTGNIRIDQSPLQQLKLL